MRISNSISFIKLRSFGIEEFQDLHKLLLDTHYNDSLGFGFDHVSASKKLLAARLVKRVPTTIPRFNTVTREFIDERIFLFSEIDLIIDAKFNLIEIYGPIKNVPKARVALYSVLSPNVQIVPVQFLLSRYYLRLLEKFNIIKIENLSVNNFQHEEGIIGRYTIKSVEQKLVKQIFEDYGHDVTRFRISVSDSDYGNFNLTISNKGNVRIYCGEDQFEELLNEIKSVLFGGGDE